jgi:hypothetical protein
MMEPTAIHASPPPPHLDQNHTPTQNKKKTQVGVLTMAGKGVELLVSPTDDVGKLLSCLHGVKVGVNTREREREQHKQLV